MSFIPIDPAAWERVEYFEYFQSTTLYMTAQVDITLLYERLKRRGLSIKIRISAMAAMSVAVWANGMCSIPSIPCPERTAPGFFQ